MKRTVMLEIDSCTNCDHCCEGDGRQTYECAEAKYRRISHIPKFWDEPVDEEIPKWCPLLKKQR